MNICIRPIRSLCFVAPASLALLAVAAFALVAPASAAPTLALETKILPIPGFPHTGDILGAGAIIEGEAALSGTEYAGSPPPLTEIRVFAPAGTKLHPQGFATCSPEAIEQRGLQACPKKSFAGPATSAVGAVSFASERVPETVAIQPFFAPGGAIDGFVAGATPVSLEIIASGHIVAAARPFGVEGIVEVPLIETLPGAPDGSFLHGVVGVGAAYRRHGKTVSYVTLPRTCPRGGWPIEVQLSFHGGATAQVSDRMPCPRASSQ